MTARCTATSVYEWNVLPGLNNTQFIMLRIVETVLKSLKNIKVLVQYGRIIVLFASFEQPLLDLSSVLIIS